MCGDGGSSADIGHYCGPERRRSRKPGQSPADLLHEMPALVVLDRLPIPTLAVGSDGTILYANPAFATMLGHSNQDAMHELRFEEIFHSLPSDEPVVDIMRAYANELVELIHCDGFNVRARMSKPALVRRDENIALTTFHELTDQLWHHER